MRQAVTILRVLLAVVVLSAAGAARATEAQEREARALYAQGAAAFSAGRFVDAHTLFQKAYLMSRAPALLYNMGSALEGAGRPHEAAEALRAYLRTVPDTPERPDIERRIRGLEEAQRILDAEALRRAPPRLLEPAPPPPYWNRRRTLGAVFGVLGVVVAATAVGVGLGLGLRQDYPVSTLQTQRATP